MISDKCYNVLISYKIKLWQQTITVLLDDKHQFKELRVTTVSAIKETENRSAQTLKENKHINSALINT